MQKKGPKHEEEVTRVRLRGQGDTTDSQADRRERRREGCPVIDDYLSQDHTLTTLNKKARVFLLPKNSGKVHSNIYILKGDNLDLKKRKKNPPTPMSRLWNTYVHLLTFYI